MLIRPATDADADGIRHAHIAAVRGTCASHYTPAEIEAWAGKLESATYARVLQERVMLVAEEAGRVLGFGQLDGDTGEIEAIYVHPDGGGRGAGALLMNELESRARARGLARLSLNASLNAVGFYMRLGFVRGAEKWLPIVPEARIRCVRMEKALTSDQIA